MPLPFALGDYVIVAGIVVALVCVILEFRRRRGWRALGFAIFDVAALAGAYALAFEASWGWNYARSPLEARTAYKSSRVNPAAIERLRALVIAQLNRLAPSAHLGSGAFDANALHAAWLPVVVRLGDTWQPAVGPPKTALADAYMVATGVSGFTNPYTHEVELASDLLWFERPFSLAHEWSHVAGFAREDEANYIAAVTCLRDPDPVAQYSGWLGLFLYLPPPKRPYARRQFIRPVIEDFLAIRKRNFLRINRSLAHISWNAYNAYLKSNRVASGVANYGEVTRLIAGIPLDANGLPETHP
jgi:Protein of unknown function (DUF3810)